MLEEVVVRTAGGSGLWAMAGTGINNVEIFILLLD
jgi:hypothetical protein